MQTPQDQYIKVGQIKTRYWAVGDEGTPVLLLHGLGAFMETWGYNVAALARHHRVYALDMVGFGRSDKPPVPYSGEYLVQFVNNFMVAQRLECASLVGNSLGGGVALALALLFPHRVSKLVLVSSAGLGRELSPILRLASVPILGELLTHPSRPQVAQFLKSIVHNPTLITKNLVDLTQEMASLPGAHRAFLATLRSMASLRGVRPEVIAPILDGLATISAPTLIVWGRQDRTLPLAHAHVAQAGLPNADLHVFDPCGHVPQIEWAEEFNALVLDFLAS
jgi:4,5:9,10-diseco-3-hydroxy-5,9,17-trioxoandrosta-1(10),2-diene-4-oate hydrolase